MTDPTPSLYHRIGGDEALRPLLQHFYSDVRQHKIIGPIFLREVDDWPSHLEKILGFWTTITGGEPKYAGPLIQTHTKLDLEPEHFEIWLDLWRRQCRIRLSPSHAEDLIRTAETMATRIQAGPLMPTAES
ncbi:MAG: hypothetical protein SynsKO_13970 [Synoicihabitans sp.]